MVVLTVVVGWTLTSEVVVVRVEVPTAGAAEVVLSEVVAELLASGGAPPDSVVVVVTELSTSGGSEVVLTEVVVKLLVAG